ncbi:uncharacterized protein LOC119271852 isoform X2 [Triticum dicoccoides]|uniref:uncharacterized protein n=1 Tax=Triticum aestivum TaxID=4565 RepID=UPI00188E879A|nr:uncharacterized protein LOC119271852 isoform X2 [Triticum dicoccoides]XP_044337161.1 uncharacterized protein LOC123058512 [Triticum aestivum]
MLPRAASRSRNPCFPSCYPCAAASSTSACVPVGLWPCSNLARAPNQEAFAPWRQMKLCSRHARRLPGSSLQPSVRFVSCRTSPDHFIHGAALASSRSGGFERQVLTEPEGASSMATRPLAAPAAAGSFTSRRPGSASSAGPPLLRLGPPPLPIASSFVKSCAAAVREEDDGAVPLR